jgi:hypothetical protein
MAKESVLRKYITAGLKDYGHIVAVENVVFPGHPDIDYCIAGQSGHIELKKLDAWPVRTDTPVRIPHYTAQQRLWLKERYDAMGRVFLLVKVMREYFLFDMPTALYICDWSQQEWRDNACMYWKNITPWEDLARRLRWPNDTRSR